MKGGAFSPASVLQGGGAGGHAWWIWGLVAVVVALNLAAVCAALGRRGGRGARPVRPPDERRLRSVSILVWSGILLVSLLIGLGIASVGPG